MPAQWMDGLTKPQINRLKRYSCAWCDANLGTGNCQAMYDPPCIKKIMKKRAADCLEASRTPHIKNHNL